MPMQKGLLRFIKGLSTLIITSLLFFSANSQTSSCWGTNCTSGDFTLQQIYLASDLSGTALTSTSCSTPGAMVNVYLALKITNGTNSDRDGVFLSGTISSGGTSTAYAHCFAGTLPHGVVATFVDPTPFVWHCGAPITMMDAFTGWNSASGPVCTGDCSGSVISKCRTYGDVIIVTPLVADFTTEASCPQGAQFQAIKFTSTTTGGITPYSYKWEIDDGPTTTTVGPNSSSTYTYTPTSTHDITVKLTVTDASNPMQTDDETKTSIVVGACCVMPTINDQPSNQLICSGGTATFSVSSSGGNPAPTIQWQEKVGAGSFANLSNGGVYSGVTTTTLTITGATLGMNGNQYRAILTSGTCTPATSSAATLTVSANSVTASATPTAIQLASAAHNSQLNAVAGSASNYSWTQDPASGGSLSASNIANPVFTATAAGTYKFVVTATQIVAPYCVAKDSVYVDVIASAPNCNLTGPTSTCASTTGLVFEGGSIPTNYSFHWSVNNGASITSSPSDSASITVTAGTSNFTVTLYITPDNPDLSPISCPRNVTVNAIPDAPTTGGDTRCGTGTVHLTASGCSGGTLKWYDAASGGNLLHTGTSYDTSISSNMTLYVSCTSAYGCVGQRASVTGTVNGVPSAPSTTGDSRCGSGQVNLSASGCNGGTLKWYDASSGGNLVNTGSSYSPILSGTTTFYVSCTSSDGCTGARASVTGEIKDIPSAPSTTGDHRCGSGVVYLSASGCSGGTLKWYDASSDGTLVNTGSSYSPSLSGTTTFYVSCTNDQGCTSSRASVTGTINDIPSAPTANDGFRCSEGVVNLSVSGCSGGTLTWYDAPSGGNVVATGSSYSPNLSVTTTFYVSCTSEQECLGTRAAVTGHIMDCTLNCTVTQGYYGSPGKSCDGTQMFNSAIDLIANLLGVNSAPHPLVIGRAGGSVTIPATLAGAIKLNSVMPGGTTPTGPLSGDCIITDACFNAYATLNGRIGNVLLSQTITLSLNARMNGGLLAGFPVQSGWLTTMKRSGCGENSTLVSCAQGPGSVASFQMNVSVVNYLTNNGANEAIVQDLLNLANDVLGGILVPGQPGAHGINVPSYSAINSTEDAFNNAFDGCRSFIGYYECRKTCSNLGIGCPLPIRFDGNIDVTSTGTSPIPPKVSVFPNPYLDKVKFTIESPVSGQATLEVYNMVGQRIQVLYNGNLQAGISRTIDYNVPENNRGNLIYILRMNDRKASGKLIRPN